MAVVRDAPVRHEPVARAPTTRLTPLDWNALPGWLGDDHGAALEAFQRTARHVRSNGPHRTGALLEPLGLTGKHFVPALHASLDTPRARARAFFEQWFTPYGVEEEGLVTGFYEPTIAAATERSERYPFPIHARPPELRKNDGTHIPASDLPSDHAWGVLRDDALHPAPDRAATETGSLRGAAPFCDWPVIAWARDRIDLYFAHIQGAARLAMPDGTVRRITYSAKSGHPFTGIGSVLRDMGELHPAAVSMATIRAWLAAHPERADAVMRQNRSYIFFQEVPVEDDALGPVAAARVPLHPGRSLAVDRALHSFGTPIHVSAPSLAWNGAPFGRLMIAQETGTAIVGAARGDIFTGSGAEAGERAGAIVAPARFVTLLPLELPVEG